MTTTRTTVDTVGTRTIQKVVENPEGRDGPRAEYYIIVPGDGERFATADLARASLAGNQNPNNDEPPQKRYRGPSPG